VKGENGNLLADSHSILNRWKNYLCQLLNAHCINDVRQTETHTAGPLVPETSSFDVEITIEDLERYKSPGTDQIPVELIQVGVIYYVPRSIGILILFRIRKNATGLE